MKYFKSLNGQSLTVLGVALLTACFVFFPDLAHAAGGLDTIEKEAVNVRSWLYAILGIGGGIYLLVCGFRLWLDDGFRLPDMGKAILKVALVAGIPAIMVWLWGTFSSSGWN